MADEDQSKPTPVVDEHLPIAYADLRRLAADFLRRDHPGHTLQPTALVNEVYIKLRKLSGFRFRSRLHFIQTASHLMRRLLVDHARERRALKRGGGRQRVTLSELAGDGSDAIEIIALNDALDSMRNKHHELAEFVELRYFAGLTLEEVAEVRGISRSSAVLTWRRAKAWLLRELSV
ncbi:MAG: ECF-type sigma factor [Myxococcota bacterium]